MGGQYLESITLLVRAIRCNLPSPVLGIHLEQFPTGPVHGGQFCFFDEGELDGSGRGRKLQKATAKQKDVKRDRNNTVQRQRGGKRKQQLMTKETRDNVQT